MALTAKLQFGDNANQQYPQEYLVADCRCHFRRGYNHAQPQSDARCDQVDLTVVAPKKENLSLFDWFISNGVQSGRIVLDAVSANNNTGDSKVIYFEDAYCYSLAEDNDIDKAEQRMLKISFVADKITISGIEFDNIYN